MAAKRKYYRWSAKIERGTLSTLQTLAESLGFVVTTPGGKLGDPSPPAFLDALAACHIADPGGTHLALKDLLTANDLLPERPPDPAD